MSPAEWTSVHHDSKLTMRSPFHWAICETSGFG
jgi:hypothetical protein